MAEDIEFKLKVIDNKLDAALDSATKKTFTLGGALESAVGNFTANLAIKGFELLGDAVSATSDFLFDSVDAAAESQVAFNRLEGALAQTGQLTEENVKKFKALGDEIQNTTAFEDDAVIGAAALIQTLGRLSSDGLEQATRAAVNLSAALKIDLESAAQLVGKSATGNIAAFGKLGIEIQKGSTDAETFANTMKVLNDRFNNAAAGQLNTFTGSVEQLKNIFGNLKETIGETVTNNSAVIAAFNTLKIVLVQVGESLTSAFGGDQTQATAEFFKAIINSVAIFTSALDAAFRIIDSTVNLIIGSIRVLALGIVTPIAGILEIAAQISPAFKSAADATTAEMERLAKGVEENAAGVATAFSKDTFLGDLTSGILGAEVIFDGVLARVQSKKDELVKGTGEIGGGASPEELAKQQALQDEITNIQLQGDLERNLLTEQMAIAKREAEGIRREEDIIALASYEQTKIDLALQAELDKNNAILNARERDLANQKAIETAKLNSQKLASKTAIDQQKFQATQEIQIQNTRLAALQGFLGAGLTLAKQGSKEAKAIQTASAIVSTYTAANQALSSPPGPPSTLPLVAATIAQGLANVARINSQSFAGGGIIGQGATAGGDNRLAQVRDGEMVLNADEQKQLFNGIKSGSIGGNAPIIIQIDGREVARAVRDQVQNGFKIA